MGGGIMKEESDDGPGETFIIDGDLNGDDGGDLEVEDGMLLVNGNFEQSAGDTSIDAMTALTLANGGNFTISGGTMRVSYEALVSVEGNYTASGGRATNGSGTVSVMGDFSQTGGATYADSDYNGGTVAHSFDISGGEFHV